MGTACSLVAESRIHPTTVAPSAADRPDRLHAPVNAGHGPKGRVRVGRPHEEYLADVCLIAKRTLGALEHSVFRFHLLLGADWKACCRRLKIDRGTFFHAVYSVEAKLGRAFRTTQPVPDLPTCGLFLWRCSGAKNSGHGDG